MISHPHPSSDKPRGGHKSARQQTPQSCETAVPAKGAEPAGKSSAAAKVCAPLLAVSAPRVSGSCARAAHRCCRRGRRYCNTSRKPTARQATAQHAPVKCAHPRGPHGGNQFAFRVQNNFSTLASLELSMKLISASSVCLGQLLRGVRESAKIKGKGQTGRSGPHSICLKWMVLAVLSKENNCWVPVQEARQNRADRTEVYQRHMRGRKDNDKRRSYHRGYPITLKAPHNSLSTVQSTSATCRPSK